MLDLLAETSGSGPEGWVQVLLQGGVSAAMLWVVVAKIIPNMLARHDEALKKQDERHSEQEDRQRIDFLTALGKIEERAEKREEAMAEIAREATNAGQTQAVAMVRLTDSIDGLRRDVETNTETLRTLNAQTKRRMTGRNLTAEAAAALEQARGETA